MSASEPWWRALSVALLLAISLALPEPIRAQTSTTLQIQPALSTLCPGETFPVSVWIDNVEDLYGYTITLSFPAGLLQLNSISNGSFLDSGMIIGPVIDNVAGTASLTDAQMNPSTPKDGSGVLLELEFVVQQSFGEGEINFLQNDLVEYDSYAIIPVEVTGGSVRVYDQQMCKRVYLPFAVH